jgi:hypothetical protein
VVQADVLGVGEMSLAEDLLPAIKSMEERITALEQRMSGDEALARLRAELAHCITMLGADVSPWEALLVVTNAVRAAQKGKP